MSAIAERSSASQVYSKTLQARIGKLGSVASSFYALYLQFIPSPKTEENFDARQWIGGGARNVGNRVTPKTKPKASKMNVASVSQIGAQTAFSKQGVRLAKAPGAARTELRARTGRRKNS